MCVATYRRPQLLQKLLASLDRQQLPCDVSLEVVVVDNDHLRSAEAVVTEAARASSHPIRYHCEPVKNISLARNRTVASATGHYLLFIDDDEWAAPRWAASLLGVLAAGNADGAFGPVLPEFAASAPEWLRRTGEFGLPVPQTGVRATKKWAGNCILRAGLLKHRPQPFDPRYGLTGGEDTHLFDRLERDGARFVYCREAIVWEHVPPERASLAYLMRREFRAGNTHTRRRLELAGRARPLLRARMMAKGVGFGAISLAITACLWPRPVARTHWLLRAASNAGRLLATVGWHYSAYR